jgi:hypothetical protein
MTQAIILLLFCGLLSAASLLLFSFLQIRFGKTDDLDPNSLLVRLFKKKSLRRHSAGTGHGLDPSEMSAPGNKASGAAACTTAAPILKEMWTQDVRRSKHRADAYLFRSLAGPARSYWSDALSDHYRGDRETLVDSLIHARNESAGDESHLALALWCVARSSGIPFGRVEEKPATKSDLTELALLIKDVFEKLDRRIVAIEKTSEQESFSFSTSGDELSQPTKPN